MNVKLDNLPPGSKVGKSVAEVMDKVYAAAREGKSVTLDAIASTPRRRNGMNRLEAAWAAELTLQVHQWLYEAVTLRLGPDCRYTPDFFVVQVEHTNQNERVSFEFHEVKGPHRRDDAMVKLRVAAERFPWFDFYLVEKVKGVWRKKLIR